MISEEEARTRILAAVDRLSVENVPLAKSAGRFLGEEVRATIAIPPFDNSAMDGYAVMAKAAKPGTRLRIVGEQPAGPGRGLRLSDGEAVRIFTGAPMPKGADAVVMQEETERAGAEVVIKAASVAAGEFVRRAGGDLTVGQLMAEAGEEMTPALIGLLAAQGLAEVKAVRKAQVTVMSTGDELIAAGRPLGPGEIYDSNAVMLAALVESAGAEVAGQTHCSDDGSSLREALAKALACDAVVISGGVSVGERDLVRKILAELGVKIDLWRVAIKPGKPFLFARKEGCSIFGLPGNPVSSFVTFQIFARAALRKMMGANERALAGAISSARVGSNLANADERAHYLRGQLRDGIFSMAGRQESHALFSLARANALLRLEPGEKVAEGELREVLLLS